MEALIGLGGTVLGAAIAFLASWQTEKRRGRDVRLLDSRTDFRQVLDAAIVALQTAEQLILLRGLRARAAQAGAGSEPFEALNDPTNDAMRDLRAAYARLSIRARHLSELRNSFHDTIEALEAHQEAVNASLRANEPLGDLDVGRAAILQRGDAFTELAAAALADLST